MKVCCITNDIEATTISGEAYNEDMAQRLEKVLPQVLALYKKYNVRATFFCVGNYIQQHPNIVKLIEQNGHEIACHGWVHNSGKAFDMLSKDEQIEHLKKAKQTLEKYTQQEIVSFRAPALRVNKFTPSALIEANFTIDSSIASQRLDMLFSFGAKNKMKWLVAPRSIYTTNTEDLALVGNSSICEIPVSAFGVPYISTTMRILPFCTKIVRAILACQTKRNTKQVVNFLFHPGEILANQTSYQLVRRSKNVVKHLVVDRLRFALKKKRLGPECLDLLEEQLQYWQKKGYEFRTLKDCVKQ